MQDETGTSSTTKTTDVDTTLTTDTTAVTASDISTPVADAVVTNVETSSLVPPVVTPTETAVSTAAVATAAGTKSWCTPAMKQYGIAGLIVLIMGVALWYLLEEQGRVETGVFDNIKGFVMPEGAALTVNGEKVPLALFEKNLSQLQAQAASQGMDMSDATVAGQVKQQAIDVLINSALLRQAAVKAGVVVTDEQINTRYQAIAESQGGEEALLTRMTELNITKEGLMNDIKDEILIQTHLSSAIDTSSVAVTDEEVETLYKSVTSNPDIDVPPLAEVREQIEQEIRFGKEQELISEYITTLKTDAKVEVLI